jgi:hypothetical protein
MRRSLTSLKLVAALALANLAGLPLLAQLDTGIIQGTVKDASGAAIPTAPVTITETQTNIRVNVMTDGQGNYVSPPLHVGIYAVSVEATGFKTYTRSGITLQVQDRLRVDAQLEVGTRTETVMVTGEVPPIQTDKSSLGQVITTQQAQDMPLNGRNYLGMLSLTPGLVGGSVNFSNVGGGLSFSANGAHVGMNNFVLDGVDNNSNDNRAYALDVNLDAIAEFKIQTSGYDAEFGRGGGAAVNAVIKSGTNQIHGSAFWFYQNAYLNAQNFFATTAALSTKFNQPGVTIGFPIIKNKLFFFGDWQYTVTHTPIVAKSSVPVFNEANGDFSGGIKGVKTIYDPNNMVNGSRVPFQNNIIPSQQITPIGHAYALLYPTANVPGAVTNNYIFEPTGTNQFMQGDGRVDYKMSDADSIFARYSQSGQTTVTPHNMPGLACGCGYRAGNVFEPKKGASLGETHVFTPSTLNEFRAGFNWYYQHVGVPDGGYQPLPSNLAIPGVQADPSYQGTPSISVSTFSTMGLGTDTPTWLSTSERQIRDTMNLVRGRHTIRFGGEYRWSQFNLFQLNDLRGQFSFNGQYTSQTGSGSGNALADLLLGIPVSSYIDTPEYLANRQHVPALFIQDDWKVSQNLTLNLGLRYEYYSPVLDVHNKQSNFDYAAAKIVVAGGTGAAGCAYCVQSNAAALNTMSKKGFAPRIGLAYTPFDKTVIRAAYGIFYTGQEDREGSNQLQLNLPFNYEPTFTGNGITPAPNGSGGFLTLPNGFPPINVANAVFPKVTSIDWYDKIPYIQDWNFTVQRALPGQLSLEVAYVGTKGVDLQASTNNNQVVVPGPGDVQSRRPYPQYGTFSTLGMKGWSTFHSLQVKADKHMSHGLYFLSAFTYGRAMQDCNIGCGAENNYNLHLLKQPSSFYRKGNWVTSFDYELPFGRGTAMLNHNKALDLIVGGWHLSGIYTMYTGSPLTPTMGFDSSNTGASTTLPNRLGNGTLTGSNRSRYQWFDLGAFVDAPSYSFGNSGYGVIVGPGSINLDAGLRKIFSITERQKLQLRLETFNSLNHPNWSNPNMNIDAGPGSAGVITAVTNNRIVQGGLKYSF